jgi:hypothetical protein
MGLTKEVRDFFTGRINRLLDAKLAKVEEQIDQKQVRKQALELVCAEAGVSPSSITRYAKIQEEQAALQEEERELRSLIYSKVKKAFPKASICDYRDDVVNEVSGFAVREFEDKILEEQYPQLVEEIAKIKLVKEDVESVVLLSTSETKLVQRLTAVLQKYGGDMPEIIQYIPE